METKLERKLGLWAVITLGLGATIGTGIFSTMSEVAAVAGSSLILVLAFIIGGLLQIPSNFCYAELASAYPQNGGYYVYIKEAGSRGLAFFCGWACFWALDPPSISIMALGLVNYLSVLLPFDNFVLRCISVCVILFFMVWNILSVKGSSIIQAILTMLKILPFVLIIGIGAFFISNEFFNGSTSSFISSDGSTPWFIALMAAVATTTFAYDGMYAPSYMTGEIKNPKKVMPIAFIATALIIIVLYVALSIVSCGLLSCDDLAASSAPIASVAAEIPVIGDYAGTVVAIMAIIVIIGTISSVIMYQPRMGYAMASDGYFFKIFAKVHPKYKSPYGAIILHCVYAIILTFLGDFSVLLGYFTLVTLIRNFATFGSIFILRKKDDYNPSYKCPLGLLFPAISCIVTLALIVGIYISSPFESSIALVLLVVSGLIAYYIWKKKDKR